MAIKLKLVEQSEHSECGLACAVMLINYVHGRSLRLPNIRNKYGVPKGGFSIANLKEILIDYSIETRAFKVQKLKDIPQKNLPLIAFWDNKHFLIISKIKNNYIQVFDPSRGKRSIPLDEAEMMFSKFILVISDTTHLKVEQIQKSSDNIFINIVKEKKYSLLFIVLISICIQLFSLAIPIVTQILIDSVTSIFEYDIYKFLWIGIIIFFLLYYILQILRGWMIAVLQTFFDIKVMKKFIGNLLAAPFNYFLNQSTGDLHYKSSLTMMLRNILTNSLISTVVDVSFLFLYLILLYNYSTSISIVVLIAATATLISTLLQTHKIKTLTNYELIEQSKVSKLVIEMIEGIETIKSTNSEDAFYNKWEEHFGQSLKLAEKKNKTDAVLGSIPRAIQVILPTIVIVYGLSEISQESLTIGELIAVNSIASSIIVPIVSLSSSYTNLILIKSYFSKIREVMDLERDGNGHIQLNNQIQNIKLDNVSFTYSAFSEPIVRNVSLNINKGNKIVIVGRSGSGKSTLLKLLSGLLQPTEGKILINNNNIKDINKKDYFSKVSMVPQKAKIFNTTVKDNILFNKEFDPKRIQEAIIKSNLEDLIMQNPSGLLTEVSEGGENFSGGQRQKIALARLFYMEPEIVILDEPTSSLDNLSERKIMNYINSNKDLTSITVAHRLSTITEHNYIIVMQDGRIVETGYKCDLISEKGIYYELYNEGS